MSWDTAVSDLRILLSDGPTDKLRAFKKVFGAQDEVNTTFKTFEFRRVTDFSSSALAAPLGVRIDNQLVPSACFNYDSAETGFFDLVVGVGDGQKLTASYYIQWFNDLELLNFIERSSTWILATTNYTDMPDGLKDAALKYAASEAYQKLSMRMAENVVETFRLEDAPDEKRFEIVKAYSDAADGWLKKAYKSRDDFYSRKGKSLAPIFGTISGDIKNPTLG